MARGGGRRNRNNNAGYAEVEMERFDEEGRGEDADVPTIEATAVAVAETSSAEGSTVTCCFQWIRFHWNWKRSLLLVFGAYALGFGSGVVFMDKTVLSTNNEDGKLQDADNDDNMFYRWKDGNLEHIEETTTTNTQSPAATTTIDPNNEAQLVPMEGSAFQDKSCKNVTYRLESPLSQLRGGPIILWAHNYAVGNAPVPAPVGPFDDPPPKQPNNAHVVLQVEEINNNKKESSWISSLLHHQSSHAKDPSPLSIVLVLSSYSMTTWTIEITQKHTASWYLSKVIATGYETPQINIINTAGHQEKDKIPPPAVEQEVFYAAGNRMPGWSMHWPPRPGTAGLDLKSYKNALESHVVGGHVYQYDYCYHGGELLYYLKLP